MNPNRLRIVRIRLNIFPGFDMAWIKVARVTGMVPCHPNQQVQCLSCTKILNTPSLMRMLLPEGYPVENVKNPFLACHERKEVSVEDLKGVSPYQNSAAIEENRMRDLEGGLG